jgi:hypothetical protein
MWRIIKAEFRYDLVWFIVIIFLQLYLIFLPPIQSIDKEKIVTYCFFFIFYPIFLILSTQKRSFYQEKRGKTYSLLPFSPNKLSNIDIKKAIILYIVAFAISCIEVAILYESFSVANILILNGLVLILLSSFIRRRRMDIGKEKNDSLLSMKGEKPHSFSMIIVIVIMLLIILRVEFFRVEFIYSISRNYTDELFNPSTQINLFLMPTLINLLAVLLVINNWYPNIRFAKLIKWK